MHGSVEDLEGRVENNLASWSWASIPLITVGFATPFVFLFAAAKKRDARHAWFGLGYLVALGLVVLAIAVDKPVTDVGFWIGWAVLWPGGFIHALMIRRWVFDIRPMRSKWSRHYWLGSGTPTVVLRDGEQALQLLAVRKNKATCPR